MKGVCKVIPVKNRLRQKLYTPGGIAREAALTAASENVETLREEFVAAVPGEVAALEKILAAAGSTNVTKETLDAMLTRAGQLLTLSGTFGLDLLDTVVKRFCDFANGMIDKGIADRAPVALHLRTMRLVCSGGPEISQTEADHMLAGLAQVHSHYGISRSKADAAPV